MLSPAPPQQLRSPTPAAVTPLRMQTIAPERTKPSDLPTTWEVPDNFVMPSTYEVPAAVDKNPPFYKITLFRGGKGSDEVYIAKALLECVPGMEIPQATQVASKVMNIGFGLVVSGLTEEVARGCAEQIRDRDMVCDVSREVE